MQHMGLGVVMMAVSVIWLVGGPKAGWLYDDPELLFIVGIITVINGCLGYSKLILDGIGCRRCYEIR